MGKRLTAVKVASYIANSTSFEELLMFQEYLGRHPYMKFYVGKLLNENDAHSGYLLKEGNEQIAEEFFESLKSEPCNINIKKRNYNTKQFPLFN
ncbi:Uncharacterised protein [uncultured archaeon]|nr:Uncharacterised protein [uncultured archaeon]